MAEAKLLAPEVSGKPIDDLNLSVRVFNALKRAGVSTIGELMEMIDKNGGNLTNLRNFGEKSMQELRAKLVERGLMTPTEEELAAVATSTTEESEQ